MPEDLSIATPAVPWLECSIGSPPSVALGGSWGLPGVAAPGDGRLAPSDAPGFEVKRTTAPTVTPSMRSALDDLKLSSLDVIHAGEQTFPLRERVRAVSAGRILEDVVP